MNTDTIISVLERILSEKYGAEVKITWKEENIGNERGVQK